MQCWPQRHRRRCRTSCRCRPHRPTPPSSQTLPPANDGNAPNPRLAHALPPDVRSGVRHTTARASSNLRSLVRAPPVRIRAAPDTPAAATHRHPHIPRFCPVHAPRKCLKLEHPCRRRSTHKRANPRPASCSSSPVQQPPFTGAPSPPASFATLVHSVRFRHSDIPTNGRVWPKAERRPPSNDAAKADGFLRACVERSRFGATQIWLVRLTLQ